MRKLVMLLLYLASYAEELTGETKNHYLNRRKQLLQEEWLMWTGSDIKLSQKEQVVNNILMHMKDEEFREAAKPGGVFPPELHFLEAKPLIEESQVFKIIKRMPKGAVLHVHDLAMLDVHWIIDNFTYMPHLYMCINNNGQLYLQFCDKTPISKDCTWSLLSNIRKNSQDPKKFDEELYLNMTMCKMYKNQTADWEQFVQLFSTMAGLFTYEQVFPRFYYQILEEFYDDNVQYLEMRTLLPKLYDLEGSVYDKSKALDIYYHVAKQFAEDHSDWAGTKTILSLNRKTLTPEDLRIDILNAAKYRQKYPDYIAGYDLVGREDLGKSLFSFINTFLNISQLQPPIDLPYFFHAGETNWEGTVVDENLFDAVLLNTTRIGHGYALVKHPELMKLIRKKNIPLEINPISNQVLGLVKDIRNHPAAILLSENFPLVISSDDPAFWNAKGVSYDYYEAFMGFGGKWANLATLKKYSAMNNSEKQKASIIWQKKWDLFIDQTLRKHVY